MAITTYSFDLTLTITHTGTQSITTNWTPALDSTVQQQVIDALSDPNKIFLGSSCEFTCTIENKYDALFISGPAGSGYKKVTSVYRTLKSQQTRGITYKTNTLLSVVEQPFTTVSFKVPTIKYNYSYHNNTYHDKITIDYTQYFHIGDISDTIPDLNISYGVGEILYAKENWYLWTYANTRYHISLVNNIDQSINSLTTYCGITNIIHNTVTCERDTVTIIYKENNIEVNRITYNTYTQYTPPNISLIAPLGYEIVDWHYALSNFNLSYHQIVCCYDTNNIKTYRDYNTYYGEAQIDSLSITTLPSTLQFDEGHDPVPRECYAEIAPILTKITLIDTTSKTKLIPYGRTLSVLPTDKTGYAKTSYWVHDNNINQTPTITPSTITLTQYNSMYVADGGTYECIYTPNEYTVTAQYFNHEQSTSIPITTPQKGTFTYDNDTITLNAPTVSNGTFLYWTNSYNNTKNYQSNYSYTNNIPANVVWTAHYSYNIKFDGNTISKIYFFDNNGTQHDIKKIYIKTTEGSGKPQLIYEKTDTS